MVERSIPIHAYKHGNQSNGLDYNMLQLLLLLDYIAVLGPT